MKDLLGREVKVGNYICYALTAGRSANLAVYQVKEVLDDKIKAVKIDESYGPGEYWKYKIYDRKLKNYRDMTEEEKFKVDNKTSTLSMPERIFILDGFSPEVFTEDGCKPAELFNEE